MSLSHSVTSTISTAIQNGDDLTGLSLKIEADDKDHVQIKHTDFSVSITVDEDGNVTVTTLETTGNGANTETFRTTETVKASDQMIENLQSITGISLDIEASDKAHVQLNHVSWEVDIDAVQKNDTTVSITQDGDNGVVDNTASLDVNNEQTIVGFDIDVEASGNAKVKFIHNDAAIDIEASQYNDITLLTTQSLASDDVWS
jgi:hypothetical protein